MIALATYLGFHYGSAYHLPYRLTPLGVNNESTYDAYLEQVEAHPELTRELLLQLFADFESNFNSAFALRSDSTRH